jgi:hypothetical protein
MQMSEHSKSPRRKHFLFALMAFLAPILAFLAYLSFGGLCIQSPAEQELLSTVSPVFLDSMKYEISPDKAVASRNACQFTSSDLAPNFYPVLSSL